MQIKPRDIKHVTKFKITKELVELASSVCVSVILIIFQMHAFADGLA